MTVSSPAAQSTIKTLREQIRRGELRPGERLPSERALSDSLGVSRPTIREAVQALAAMNVLVARRGSGTYVASLAVADLLQPLEFALELTEPTIRSLFEVRLALEPLAAALAAERASTEQRQEFTQLLARIERRRLTRQKLLELDVELHTLIVEAAENDLLRTISGSLTLLGRKSRELTIRRSDAVPQAVREHRAIVEAIVAGRPKQARAAMESHIANVRDALDGTNCQ